MVLGVTSICVTLSVKGFGLVVVPVTNCVGAGLCIISKNVGESLKRKEQHKTKIILLLVEH